MPQSNQPDIDNDEASNLQALLREIEQITPSNDELRKIATMHPPAAGWLSGDEERPF